MGLIYFGELMAQQPTQEEIRAALEQRIREELIDKQIFLYSESLSVPWSQIYAGSKPAPSYEEIIAEPVAGFSPKIYFSLKADPIFGLSALTSFKNIDLAKTDYIDLRVPNRAYYKLK